MRDAVGAHLAREQASFLRRDRRAWDGHLARVRGFLGAGLARADRNRPVLILGAGSGLEVPWGIAPPGALGWDADPWSRLRTALRHRRWPGWDFSDLTGAMAGMESLARRCARESWGVRRPRPLDLARTRLAGLLPSLPAEPAALRAGLEGRRPGTVLSANVMGQFGAVAQTLLAGHLGEWWTEPFPPEDLIGALEAWVARLVRAHLEVLAGSGAELWLVHDRGVLHGGLDLRLGPWAEPWPAQVEGRGSAELEDPLGGVDPVAVLTAAGRTPQRRERWLWPVAGGQTHLVEALACPAPGGTLEPGPPGR